MQIAWADESSPLHSNDVDFCLRVRAAGYRQRLDPYAEMIHTSPFHVDVKQTRENRALNGECQGMIESGRGTFE